LGAYSLISWSLLPTGFLKLNFDRASKGNLGPIGFGGAFHNSSGQLLWIYADYIGIENNNAT
jgi:hypothetical protein